MGTKVHSATWVAFVNFQLVLGIWSFSQGPLQARLRSKAFCPEDEGLLKLPSLYSKADNKWALLCFLCLPGSQ